MREIKTHTIEGDSLNHQLKIEVLDESGAGGANHRYCVSYPDMYFELCFQNGPIAEAGVNGISNEALLAIVMDRLEGFQRSDFACEETRLARMCIEAGLAHLKNRTKERLSRGVEGTLQK